MHYLIWKERRGWKRRNRKRKRRYREREIERKREMINRKKRP